MDKDLTGGPIRHVEALERLHLLGRQRRRHLLSPSIVHQLQRLFRAVAELRAPWTLGARWRPGKGHLASFACEARSPRTCRYLRPNTVPIILTLWPFAAHVMRRTTCTMRARIRSRHWGVYQSSAVSELAFAVDLKVPVSHSDQVS
jgi:hypothetical protein